MNIIGLNTDAHEQHILTIDSVDLYVKIRGSGTPCLFIHGGPGSGSYWVEKSFGKELEQYFKMIYLDQRGVWIIYKRILGRFQTNDIENENASSIFCWKS